MPIIASIGRKALRVRILVWGIYIVLSCGALTMVYPFMLMVAGSSKSAIDTSETRLVPAFLTDDDALYRKHVEGFFNESLGMMHSTYHSSVPTFEALQRTPANRELVKLWVEFLEETPLPHYSYTCSYVQSPVTRGVFPINLRRFKNDRMRHYGDEIDALNRDTGMEFRSWNAFFVNAENYVQRRSMPIETSFRSAFYEFKETRPYHERYYFDLEGYYKTAFLKTQYTRDIEFYNRKHGTTHESWDDVQLAQRIPTGPGHTVRERDDWLEFVRHLANLLWIRVDTEVAPLYRRFLASKYQDITALNRLYDTSYASFNEVPPVDVVPVDGAVLSDWAAFISGWKDDVTGETFIVPAEMISVHSVDSQFRDYLRGLFRQIGDFNSVVGADYSDWQEISPPQLDLHAITFEESRAEIRREFVLRNFITVVNYMALHGRSILNTAIYCILAILGALTVNPLAAYALSRYKPPVAYKVLLFLMLTMAFPPMVTQIPNFLMLRELGLLNTFWALILPGLANGYSIFLLKGFFDSLPQELYESAELDGAGEFRIFWQITLSLSKPILAVIALQAFTIAYSNFMMALLICQDEKMWTLMPWLYQLQQRSGQGVIFSSLLIAAVPTFIVFVFCQNVIMRGIVVPVEK